MADKSFGVKQLDILGTGESTISAPDRLKLDSHNVAISTSLHVGAATTVGGDLLVSGVSTFSAGGFVDIRRNVSISGIATIAAPYNTNAQVAWTVTNNSASAYRFTGPGQSGSDDNPDLYLVRGQRYIFKHEATSSHPLEIRVANGGAAYNDGVTNNGQHSTNITFNVQHDAPAQLFYQCTSHGGMVGNIYIVGGPQVISGVVTATTFVGALTGTASGNATISSNGNDRIITGGSGNALTGEANLQFDGTNLFMSDELRHLGDPDTKIGFDTDTIKLETAGAERLRITSSGTAVFGGNAAAPIVDNGELYYRGNSTSTFQNLPQNFYLYSDDKAYNATNPGAGLLFGGTYTSTGQYTTFSGIHGIKENNTDNNYSSALVFGTRQQGSSTWERLRIDSNGDLLHSSSDRNYASWYKIPTNSSSNAATTSTEILTFGTAVIANTDVYNTSNGRYTAPVDGLYHIRCNGLIDNNASDGGKQLLMYRNGSVYGSQIAYNSRNNSDFGDYHMLSGTGIMYMSAGDYAQIHASAGMHVSNETSFIVYLIRATK